MLKASYKPFMDLMKQIYDNIFSEEKDEFSNQDLVSIIFLSLTLDSLCFQINKELEKRNLTKREED